MNESEFIEALKALATNPAARGLMDDAAVLDVSAGQLVLTHDMLVEGVHYLPDDPPETVAWKLVAVNISDLAAKGATPAGALLGFSLSGSSDWERAFVAGLREALTHFGLPLLGGDTVAMPEDAPRALGLTAIGIAPQTGAPSRAGAKPGDTIFVSGTVGDAGAGLAILDRQVDASGDVRATLIESYRRPTPSIELGRALAPLATAMSDISDGLLIDADRMARASGCAIRIDLAAMPLSAAFSSVYGDGERSRLAAATAGDDYRLLFAVAADRENDVHAIGAQLGFALSRVGRCEAGNGLSLACDGKSLPLPGRLGHEHGAGISG